MIYLHNQDTEYSYTKKRRLKNWIKNTVKEEGFSIGEINIIFTSDDYLLEINKNFLSHDYYTDVITFDYSDNKKISGDIFISVDRVRENAEKYKEKFFDELNRVIIHGILHLLGYKDKTSTEKHLMRKKEDFYLKKLKDYEK